MCTCVHVKLSVFMQFFCLETVTIKGQLVSNGIVGYTHYVEKFRLKLAYTVNNLQGY